MILNYLSYTFLRNQSCEISSMNAAFRIQSNFSTLPKHKIVDRKVWWLGSNILPHNYCNIWFHLTKICMIEVSLLYQPIEVKRIISNKDSEMYEGQCLDILVKFICEIVDNECG